MPSPELLGGSRTTTTDADGRHGVPKRRSCFIARRSLAFDPAHPPEKNRSMAIVTALAQALCSLATPPRFAVRAPTHPGLRIGESRLRADVFEPEGACRGRVVLVHGGGFLIGSRSMKPMKLLSTRLALGGFAVCSVDYRLLLRGGRLTQALEDVVAAARWWKERSAAAGMEAAPLSMVGLSAGGTLALLAARELSWLRRIVSVFGLYDFSELRGPLAGLLPRLLLGTGDRGRWRAASPIGNADVAAPVLLVHGGRDGLVPVSQHHALEHVRRAKGLPTETLLFPDEPHAFLNRPSQATDATVEALMRFLAKPPA